MGVILQSVADAELDSAVEARAQRMATDLINQRVMQKLLVNQAIGATGLFTTQRLAALFDGISRHSPEGMNFKARSETVGRKKTAEDSDQGTYDWTADKLFHGSAGWSS